MTDDDLPDAGDMLEAMRRNTGPIEAHIEALGQDDEIPSLAIAVCTARADEAAPYLIALLERAAEGAVLTAAEETRFFCAIHILGAARVELACAPLLRFLRGPADGVTILLGDANTETLSKIVAGVFDGDAEALFDAIADLGADEFVRHSLLGAATFLTWEGRIDRARMESFLIHFFEANIAPAGDFAWAGWQQAIALLGLRDLAPRVREAIDGRLPEDYATFEHFEAMLDAAEQAPDDIGRFHRESLGYIEDPVETLSRFGWDEDADEDDLDLLADDGDFEDLEGFEDFVSASPEYGTPDEPVENPFRHVGRNDPCPCGSGKKFKRCCLDLVAT